MKIAAISDVHNNWHKVDFKPADVLVIAGDMTNDGWKHEFNDMLSVIECYKNSYDEVIVIAGNHDGKLFERTGNGRQWFKDRLRQVLDGKGIYLEHEAAEIMGLKVFGTPYVRDYCNLGFNRSDEQRANLWADIPLDTELLITHMPPYAILDGTLEESWVNGQLISGYVPAGCPFLRDRIEDLPKLKAHIFGHIHDFGSRKMVIDDITFVNASYMGTYKAPRTGEMVLLEI